MYYYKYYGPNMLTCWHERIKFILEFNVYIKQLYCSLICICGKNKNKLIIQTISYLFLYVLFRSPYIPFNHINGKPSTSLGIYLKYQSLTPSPRKITTLAMTSNQNVSILAISIPIWMCLVLDSQRHKPELHFLCNSLNYMSMCVHHSYITTLK